MSCISGTHPTILSKAVSILYAQIALGCKTIPMVQNCELATVVTVWGLERIEQ